MFYDFMAEVEKQTYPQYFKRGYQKNLNYTPSYAHYPQKSTSFKVKNLWKPNECTFCLNY